MAEQRTERLVVDPITRIEGHLRIEAELNGTTIENAYSSGTSVRGIEIILQGRDPRDAWAFAQRICGVCTLVHGIASVRAVEDAIRTGWQNGAELAGSRGPGREGGGPPQGAGQRRPEAMGPPPGRGPGNRGPNNRGPQNRGPENREQRAGPLSSSADIANADQRIPVNAELIRNLMIGTQFIHDHVVHFYHLHALDWVDVVSALEADPQATATLAQSISPYPRASVGHFRDMQARIRTFVESGQLGIFGHAYWGHSGYNLPAEANLMAVAHYLDALQWQREVVKIHTIFGGKNPHPNFLVGGVPSPISLNSDSGINSLRLSQVSNILDQMEEFVEQVYVPDIIAIASFYKDWANRGEGLGNFLTFGDLSNDGSGNPASFLFPRGAILNRDLSTIHEVDLEDSEQVQEFVARSWYDYGSGDSAGLHPWQGETELNYTGPQPPYEQLNVDSAYSWLKSPRWRGNAMEVGPLARVLMLYASNDAYTRELVDSSLSQLNLPIDALYSTLGRTLARALETQILMRGMRNWYDQLLTNIKADNTDTFNELYFDPANWPVDGRGVGFMEAPRGALAHWLSIGNGVIDNYQCVVPSTWNAGPRDANNQPGAYEAALAGHALADPSQPLEILRTIHSFDPCLACAVHLLDEDGSERLQIKVR